MDLLMSLAIQTIAEERSRELSSKPRHDTELFDPEPNSAALPARRLIYTVGGKLVTLGERMQQRDTQPSPCA